MKQPSYYSVPGMKGSKLSIRITSKDIITMVCKTYGVEHEDLMKQCRQRELVFSRHLAMYLIRKFTNLSVIKIGKLFNRDHTSVLHAQKMIQNYIDTDSFNKREEIQQLINRCEYRIL